MATTINETTQAAFEKMISDLDAMIPKIRELRLRRRLAELRGFLVHGNPAAKQHAANQLRRLLSSRLGEVRS